MSRASAPTTAVARPDLVLCGGRGSGVEPLWRAIGAHPEIALAEPDDFADVQGDADTFPLNVFDPLHAGPGGGDAFDAIARRAAGRAGRVAWRPGGVIEWPHVVPLVAESLPDARLLFCLRDPIAATCRRYESARHEMPATLDAAIDASLAEMSRLGRSELRAGAWNRIVREPPATALLLQSGVYEPAVRRAIGRFPPERVMVVPFERLMRDRAALRDVATFLDVDPEPLLGEPLVADAVPDTDAVGVARLRDFFEPWNHRLFELVGWPVDTWTGES